MADSSLPGAMTSEYMGSYATAYQLPSLFWITLAVFSSMYVSSIVQLHVFGPKAPLVGPLSAFEPRIVANFRLFRNPGSVITKGYKLWKDKIFWFARNDADMVVLPLRFVDEIRNLAVSVANPTHAHVHNLLGSYTRMDLILESNLHFRAIQGKLTPALGSLAEPMQEELDYGIEQDFPKCKDDFVEFHPYHTILRLVARLSARIFVGLPHCRDESWLEVSTQFTENVFVSLLALRMFPVWTHRFICWVMPPLYRNSRYIRRAQKLLVPKIIAQQKAIKHAREHDLPPPKSDNLLSWMIDISESPVENDPWYLAHLEIVVSLASIHTSQMNTVHVLLDLAAHPEYVEPLREEILAAARDEDGKWTKATFAKLRKLDSFLKESQRLSPPSLLSYHRLMTQAHVLSDGTVLPKGAHICMATSSIQNDPSVTANPEVFDPFRYEQMRNRDGEGHLHQFTTTTGNTLNFGHGKYACPGRFFAALEIKSILVKLIMSYDFKLMPGETRPKNLEAYEFIFPNPSGSLLVKERFRPADEQVLIF